MSPPSKCSSENGKLSAFNSGLKRVDNFNSTKIILIIFNASLIIKNPPIQYGWLKCLSAATLGNWY